MSANYALLRSRIWINPCYNARMKRKWWIPLLIVGLAILAVLYALLIPSIRERVNFYWQNIRAQIFYALNPPEEETFLPQASLTEVAIVPSATLTQSTGPVETAAPTNTPAVEPTPLPSSVALTGTVHEYQGWNNCGPATLSIALSYWGWDGDQRDTASWIKPNSRDKNTTPEEMAAFVETIPGLSAVVRYGGDLDVLRALVAAGYPVIIERGLDTYNDEGWLGHYTLVPGYDDIREVFITQDALIMPDLPVPYAEIAEYWPHFNGVFIVVYAEPNEPGLMAVLGEYADASSSYQIALAQNDALIAATSGYDQYFALFGRGSSLTLMGDYSGAAVAYDQAFALYATLPEEQRPWRMMWYQHGPYLAYYSLGRYQDVINLATFAVSRTSEPALEEAFLWRGRAELALGDLSAAESDFRTALVWHPNWQLAIDELSGMGLLP